MDWMYSEAGVALVGAVVGAVWTAFRSSDWWQRRVAGRRAQAMLALEAGVEQTYRAFVRGIKLARNDGKLTDTERARARDMALEAAIRFGRARGVDVLRELGAEFVDLHLARALQGLRGGRQSAA